jgi:hypothetical protein
MIESVGGSVTGNTPFSDSCRIGFPKSPNAIQHEIEQKYSCGGSHLDEEITASENVDTLVDHQRIHQPRGDRNQGEFRPGVAMRLRAVEGISVIE